MKAISLFSGMGGDSLGMKKAGFEVIAHSEINPVFQQTHKVNFPDCQLIGTGDLSKTTDDELASFAGDPLGPVDLIFAGFPCQGFSNAGQKKVNDPRNTLFKEFLRATKIIQPNYIIGENVKGLLSRKNFEGRNYIDLIKESFEEEGYKIFYETLLASDYGLPQKRERLFIVGIKESILTELSSMQSLWDHIPVPFGDDTYPLCIPTGPCAIGRPQKGLVYTLFFLLMRWWLNIKKNH